MSQRRWCLGSESSQNITEQRWSIASRGSWIYSRVLFYIYLASISGETLLLPKYKVVSSATKALTSIVYTWSEEPDMNDGLSWWYNTRRCRACRFKKWSIQWKREASESCRVEISTISLTVLLKIHQKVGKIRWASTHNSPNEMTRKKSIGKAS